MANLLHRLLRGRRAEEIEGPLSASADEVAAEQPSRKPEPGEPPPSTPKAATRGPRKTRDEVSSIGPGEP